MGACTSSAPEEPGHASLSEEPDDASDDESNYASLEIEAVGLDLESIPEPRRTRSSSGSLSTDATDASQATEIRHPLKQEHAFVGGTPMKDIMKEEQEKYDGEAMIGMFGDPEENLEHETETILKWDTYTRRFTKETLKLCLVKKHHSLWGEYIYNAARVLSDLIDGGGGLDGHATSIAVEGKSVIELGAGAGLPSVVSALCGAVSVCITDYGRDGDRGLVEAIDRNISDLQEQQLSLPCVVNHRLTGHPYVWGEDCRRLLEANGGHKYDIVILADCIFNRSVHRQLVESMAMLMEEVNGVCYCSFSHHDPQKTELDLRFLEICREQGYATILQHKEQRQSYPFAENDGLDDARGWVYVYEIKREGPS